MTQESGLTREEIEALDESTGTLGYEPPKERSEPEAQLDQREVVTQQPEDRS